MWTAVVCDDPGEDGVLGEVVAAAVSQVVEVQQILVVAEEAALPQQHVALRRLLRHVVLWPAGEQSSHLSQQILSLKAPPSHSFSSVTEEPLPLMSLSGPQPPGPGAIPVRGSDLYRSGTCGSMKCCQTFNRPVA